VPFETLKRFLMYTVLKWNLPVPRYWDP